MGGIRLFAWPISRQEKEKDRKKLTKREEPKKESEKPFKERYFRWEKTVLRVEIRRKWGREGERTQRRPRQVRNHKKRKEK